ncbi:BTAD domain-containing putative transcriptional regulator [Streptomyces sp. NPDC005077]|uniref:AfsR/SARP family transcriptional regulator n=1 Tax=Streptomyces sp. NPDC005077 TaxID=3154292 RepID=UPI0033AE417C
MHYKHVDGAEAAGSQASSAAAGFPAYATCEWPGSGVRIDVLGGFGLWVGDEPVAVPAGSERVLAFVALCCRAAVPRPMIAGTLWPETSEPRACTNLRSALARLRTDGRRALDIGPASVCLARGTTVDLHHAQRVARRVLASTDPARLPGSIPAAVEALSVDLLPGWYDDWAQLEAEEWRQLRLHALETLAGRLIAAGRHAEAVSAAHAAVHADPLRESGQTRLLQAHLAEGNRSEALHAFRRYSRRLHEELGLEPTERLRGLVAEISPSPRTDAQPGR